MRGFFGAGVGALRGLCRFFPCVARRRAPLPRRSRRRLRRLLVAAIALACPRRPPSTAASASSTLRTIKAVPPAIVISSIVSSCAWEGLLALIGSLTSSPKKCPSTQPSKSGMPAGVKGPPHVFVHQLSGYAASNAFRILRCSRVSGPLAICPSMKKAGGVSPRLVDALAPVVDHSSPASFNASRTAARFLRRVLKVSRSTSRS